MKSFILMIIVAFTLLIAACEKTPIKPVQFAREPQTPDEQAVPQRNPVPSPVIDIQAFGVSCNISHRNS